MSNRVFPEFRGLAWPVERESLWPGEHIEATPSGREFSSTPSTYPRLRYTLNFPGLLDYRYEADQLIDFYDSVRGRIDDFLFHDPDDCQVDLQALGIGNGSATAWQLGRSRNNLPGNMMTYSIQPSYGWSGGGVTKELVNPIPGDLSWVKMLELNTGVASTHSTFKGSTATRSGTRYTFTSRYIPIDRKICALVIYSPTIATIMTGYFNTETGAHTMGGSSAYKASGIEDHGDHFRVWITFETPVGTEGTNIQTRCALIDDSGSGSYIGDTSKGGYYGRTSLYEGDYIGEVAPTFDNTSVPTFLHPTFDVMRWPIIYFRTNADGFTQKVITTDYTISTTGMLTFVTPPPAGTEIFWSGSFLHRCRFDMGSMSTSQFAKHLFASRQVQIITRKL